MQRAEASPGGGQSLGLPTRIRACLFDLDGVLVRTADAYAATWKGPDACDRKQERFLAYIRRHGLETYPGAVRYVEATRRAGIAGAVISRHPGAHEVIEAAGIAHLFDERLDGSDIEQLQLKGKPAPDVLLAAARALWVFPAEAAVFEAAPAGITAARAGSFGHVIGVDHTGEADALWEGGADIVVHSLSELLHGG